MFGDHRKYFILLGSDEWACKEKQNKTSVFFGGAVVDADNGFFLLWRCRCKRERRTEAWMEKESQQWIKRLLCLNLKTVREPCGD